MIAGEEIEEEYQIPTISLKKAQNDKANSKISKIVKPSEKEDENNQKKVEIKFLSKKEREEQRKKKEEEERQKQEEQFKRTKEIRKEYDKFRYKDYKKQQEYEERRRRYQEELQQRARSRSRSRSNEKYSKQKHETDETEQNQQAESIKIQYLGIKKEHKKLVKPSEKFKNIFNFEWDPIEDTSKDYNLLYQRRLNEKHMFGRGIKAGYDREKKQKMDDFRSESVDPFGKPKGKLGYDMSQGDHWSTKLSSEMNERDWRIFREDNDIIIKGGRVPKPMREWDEYKDIPSYMLDSLLKLKYHRPTPIQMQAIPIGLLRKDMIGIAPTGSGKSAAYLIPLIIYLKTLPPMTYERAKDGPYSLILLPSRELAPQVEREFNSISKDMGIKPFVCVGGRQQEEQMFQLQQGCELLIGTPGRIKDAIEQKYLVLDQCSWVVLDEADKMIDLGFEEDVNFILDSIKSEMKSEDENKAEIEEQIAITGEKIYRVTHLFSATMPNEVENMAKKYLRAFCYISIGEPGGGKKDIDQVIELVNESEKRPKLKNILLRNNTPPIIIFANEKKSVDSLAKVIESWGWNCVCYHGGKSQQQREAAVDGFKARRYDILIATDLGGRGLHVEGVKLVINYDAPKNIRDFVHRTGRTGRAGKKGLAFTFLTNKDEMLFYDLKNFLIQNDQPVPETLEEHPSSRMKPGTLELVPRKQQVVYAQ